MKAIDIFICILFASLLISFPSIAARELVESNVSAGSGGKRDPKRAISCGKPDNPSYSKCIAKQKPKCKNRYKRGCELAPKGN